MMYAQTRISMRKGDIDIQTYHMIVDRVYLEIINKKEMQSGAFCCSSGS